MAPLALSLLVVCLARPARSDVACPADTGDAAAAEAKGRELFDRALEREAADPRSALEILLCVQRLADKPAVSLRVGIIAERLGNTKLAMESFERYLALAGSAAPDRAEMKKHIDALRRELEKSQGGAKPPPPSESGAVPPAEEHPPSGPTGRSTLPGWLVVGAGGAVMVVGGVLLFDAKKKNDDVHSIDPGTTYWNSDAARTELDKAKREQAIGYAALGIGAAATAVGVWLVLDAKHVSASASVGPGATRAVVRVTF